MITSKTVNKVMALYVTRILEGGVARGRARELADRAAEASLGAGDQEDGADEEEGQRHLWIGNSVRGDRRMLN